MLVLCCISGVIVFYYVYLILQFKRHIAERPAVSSDVFEEQKVSVLIPFRNEERHLEESLNSLSKVEYPRDNFEIIFINDHSTDNSIKVFNEFNTLKNIKLIDNKGIGKKNAILIGIEAASFNWILASDADCIYDEKWLTRCNQLINNIEADMFVLPVSIKQTNSILSDFQYYESLSSIGVNAGSYSKYGNILLASGANLLYRKKVFLELDPYFENLAVASGDDMFLLEKFKNENRKIVLSLEANSWVSTNSESTWWAVISQRIRWAKKMQHFKFKSAFNYGLFILMIQLTLWLLMIFSFINFDLILFFIVALFLKSIADYQLMKEVSKIKKWKIQWSNILVHELLYMLMLPIITIFMMFKTPRWKERKIHS